jgi:hypothetical protein
VHVGVNHLSGGLHAAPPAPTQGSSLVPLAIVALGLLVVAVLAAALLAARR